MLNWLFSRPLQVKFFLGTMLFVVLCLLVLVLNVSQVLNPFMTHYLERDMRERTHILAMTLMDGAAAHNPQDLQRLLQDISEMHGYCYLRVQNDAGKLLASAGSDASKRTIISDLDLDRDLNGCFDGSIPLLHDGKPYGTLHYGVDISFVETLKRHLRNNLIIVTALWLVIGAGMYYLLVRRMVRPLQAITRASESMAHGNLNAAMPQNLPQDELGKLASGFSNMASALRERIESQHRYAHALYTEQARLNALLTILPVGVMFVDPERKVQYINQECRRLWGLPEGEDFVGRSDTDLITIAAGLQEHPETFTQQMEVALKEYGVSAPFDTRLNNDRIVRSRSCVVPDAAGERYVGRMWMFEDVSEEHLLLQEARVRAERDALTGLYNRRRFEEDVERLFAQAQRNGRRLTLLYFDLDDFKRINDAYGHVSGDAMLKGIAQALSLQSRRNEELYRLGGDEFAILVADADLQQVEALARRVITAVEQLPFSFGGKQVHINCSMGIAAYSPETRMDTSMDLIQQADIAMYQAKHFGKNRWHVFDPEQPLDLGRNSR